MAVIMKCTRHNFLPATAFSDNQDAAIYIAKTPDHFVYLMHDVCLAQEQKLVDCLCGSHQLIFLYGSIDDYKILFA